MKYEQIQNAIIKAINSNIHKAAGKQFFISMGSNTDTYSVSGTTEITFDTITKRKAFDILDYDLIVVNMFEGNLNNKEYTDSLFGMIDYVASCGGYISIGNDMHDMENIYMREFDKATDLDQLSNDDEETSDIEITDSTITEIKEVNNIKFTKTERFTDTKMYESNSQTPVIENQFETITLPTYILFKKVEEKDYTLRKIDTGKEFDNILFTSYNEFVNKFYKSMNYWNDIQFDTIKNATEYLKGSVE